MIICAGKKSLKCDCQSFIHISYLPLRLETSWAIFFATNVDTNFRFDKFDIILCRHWKETWPFATKPKGRNRRFSASNFQRRKVKRYWCRIRGRVSNQRVRKFAYIDWLFRFLKPSDISLHGYEILPTRMKIRQIEFVDIGVDIMFKFFNFDEISFDANRRCQSWPTNQQIVCPRWLGSIKWNSFDL